MSNLIPKSLRVSLKLCAAIALLIACSGCMPIANALIVIGAHDGLNSMNPNQNSGDIVYPQTQNAENAAAAAAAEASPVLDGYDSIPVDPAILAAFGNHSTAKQP